MTDLWLILVILQIYSWAGVAVPRREWEWSVPLVPLPQLCTNVEMELWNLRSRGEVAVVFSLEAFGTFLCLKWYILSSLIHLYIWSGQLDFLERFSDLADIGVVLPASILYRFICIDCNSILCRLRYVSHANFSSKFLFSVCKYRASNVA